MRRLCMTQLLVLVVVVLCSFQYARAATVLLTQGFDNVDNLLVDGWYQINHSDPLGLTDWFQGDDTLFPAQAGVLPDSYVAANFDNTSDTVPGTISNWLISPVVNFAGIGKFTFWTRTVDTPAFPDRMEVRLSTNGISTNVGSAATDVGDFTTVLVEINPTQVTDPYPTGYPAGWTQYEITSTSLPAAGTGRIAFRYYVTDAGLAGTNAEYIGVDTVEVISKNDYTLTYTAGAHGSISGTTPQTVLPGEDGTSVTALPEANYKFVNWSDGSTANPRTDTNVLADVTVTANFALNTYTVTYTAAPNGVISGTSPQTVNYGGSSTPVTALANTGYHFVNWSDASEANPRTDTNVTADITVTANFAINTYTLTYTAGTNGSITGTSPQTVNHGASGTAVTAVPNTGYHFVNWSDASTANPRTDINVTADITVTANFAINTYTLTYTAGTNGSITGTSPQTVNHGAAGTAVTAVPNTGYHFVNWSDASTASPRTDTNVTADISVTANFAVDTYSLGVAMTGSGKGKVTSDVTGIDCQNDCDEIYEYGTVVVLTAAPASGSTFKGWSGDCTGTDTTCTVTIEHDINVTAEFSSFPWNLFLPALMNNNPKP